MGCGFNITPMWHPLRLAEDFAMVDVLTGGRVRFGVGRGYHTREVDTFGSPLLDQVANRELFEEQVEIIFKAFNNAVFSHEGKHYTIPARAPYRGYGLKDLTLVPRPVHPVECWQPIQTATPRGMDFMAKHDMSGLIGGGVAEGGARRAGGEAWPDAVRRARGPPAQIIDTLMRLEEDYPGLERVSVSHPIGASESLMLEQLEWFATEVMPAFTGRAR